MIGDSTNIAEEDALAPPGDTLDQGELLSATWLVGPLIGTGGMAAVYAATGLRGERAAVKVMRSDLAMQPGLLQRFLREGTIARRVDHPHMVYLYGEGTTDAGNPYLAFELLDGCTIDTLFRSDEHRPTIPQLLRYFLDVMDLMAACHDQGIVHRDLKPANLYVTRWGRAKVLDFGVARAEGLSEEFLRPGTAMGTPSFMAPEQAMGAWEHVDASADVFSLGATLFALLSGQRLHHGKSEAASFKLAATRRAPCLRSAAASLPADVVAFVDRALAWDKRARFPTAREMRDELQQIILGLDPDDTPIVPPVVEVAAAYLVEPSDSEAGTACAEAFQLLCDAWVARQRRKPVDQTLAVAIQRMNAAVEAETGSLVLAVLPWCLRLRDQTVWSPEESLARALEAMFADGIRSIEILPGCPDSALIGFFDEILARAEELPDDGSDSVCALWPLEGEHFHVGVAVGMLAASAGTADHAANGQATVRRLVEAGGGISERFPRLSSVGAAELVLDSRARTSLAQGLMPSGEHADHAFVRALVSALEELVEGATARSHALGLIGSLAEDLLRAERADLLLDTAVRLAEAHDREAVLALLPPGCLGDLVQAIDRQVAGTRFPPEARTLAMQHLAQTLDTLGESGIDGVIQILPSLESPDVGHVVTSYIERHLPAEAVAVANTLSSLSGEVGFRLVLALWERAPDRTSGALETLASYHSSPLRIAAHAALHGSRGISATILAQLEAPGWRSRQVALLTLQEYDVPGAGDALRRRAESPAFHALDRRERQLTLEVLASRDPELAESVIVALVKSHGLLRDDTWNDTRVLAAGMLAATSRSAEVAHALRAAEAPMWWNPPYVRNAARHARRRVERRIRSDGSGEEA